MSQQPMGAGFYKYRIEGGELIRTAVLTLPNITWAAPCIPTSS